MTINRIFAKKQDNGIWGTPQNLYRMDMGILPKDDLHFLISGMIIKFDEMYNVRFRCKVGETYMTITHEVNNGYDRNKTYTLHYKDYRIVNDKLYFLETDEDKIKFSRSQKIHKIKNNI